MQIKGNKRRKKTAHQAAFINEFGNQKRSEMVLSVERSGSQNTTEKSPANWLGFFLFQIKIPLKNHIRDAKGIFVAPCSPDVSNKPTFKQRLKHFPSLFVN